MANVDGNSGAKVLAGFSIGLLVSHALYPLDELHWALLRSELMAQWVSAIATVIGAIGVWFAFVDFREKRRLQRELVRARLIGLKSDLVNAMSVFTGIANGFQGLQTHAGLGPWIQYCGNNVLAIDTSRLAAASEHAGIGDEVVTWCELARTSILRAQGRIRLSFDQPNTFHPANTLQDAVAASIPAIRQSAERVCDLLNPGVPYPWTRG